MDSVLTVEKKPEISAGSSRLMVNGKNEERRKHEALFRKKAR